jgi:hypothetical protein
MERERACATPTPAPGGRACPGNATEHTSCTGKCPKSCEYALAGHLLANHPIDLTGAIVTQEASGEIVFMFDSPKVLTSIAVQTVTNTEVTVLLRRHSQLIDTMTLISNAHTPVENTLSIPMNVDEIVLQPTGTEPLDRDDVVVIIVHACDEDLIVTTVQPQNDTSVCVYTDWTAWSTCTKSCGMGSKTRMRVARGAACKDPTQVQTADCNTHACMAKCEWSPWGKWTKCSKSCNGGQRQRRRTILREGKTKSTRCTQPKRETESCNTNKCDKECTNGKVFTDCAHKCPQTCADLTKDTCTEDEDCQPGCRCPINMVENDKGACVQPKDCQCMMDDGKTMAPGETVVDKERCEKCTCTDGLMECDDDKCTVDCGFSDWTIWGQCSAECGGGVQHRFRSANHPSAEHGGKECVGPTNDTQSCNTHTCAATTTTPAPTQNATTPTPKACSLTPITQDLYADDGDNDGDKCVAKAVTLDKCLGSCPSMQATIESNGKFVFTSSCYCCLGEPAFTAVEFDCPHGGPRTIQVPHHSSCDCQLCSEHTSEPPAFPILAA